MMSDQFAPIDKPYLDQWQKRLTDPKPVKVKPRKKGKKAKVRK